MACHTVDRRFQNEQRGWVRASPRSESGPVLDAGKSAEKIVLKNMTSLAIPLGTLTHEIGCGPPRLFLTSSSGVSAIESSLRSMG